MMEKLIRIMFLHIVMMRSSPAEELKRNLTGVVGGSITLPDLLLEFGFFLDKLNTVAMVKDGKLEILEEKYKNKLHWNKDSGLFTLTDLQKNDSDIYKIDSKRGLILTFSYSVTVYDPAPTPAVETLNVSSDSCWLLCSVDKLTALLWYRDEEIQNQNSSALSLPITVYKQDRDSSYRCVAANPAENKTLHVNVTTSCGINSTEGPDNHRIYWIAAGVSLFFVAFVAAGSWMIKQRYLGKKASVRQTQGRYLLILFFLSDSFINLMFIDVKI
ncbi:CD48 antigen-like [Girardinichthys multiradiatus]|uniref:CD48 antigen-like n=1 Tax=Girardinichthys multiradiatus TaxID=208333 RepID=UPI001FABDAA0|nr:CD48 antigen-like [Girardinichthys multiradiatus]